MEGRNMRASGPVVLAFVLFHGCGKELGPEAKVPEGVALGLRAPEIDGVDADGLAFKLSDYRGRVVVLSFWGEW